jgi:hypothetical protein
MRKKVFSVNQLEGEQSKAQAEAWAFSSHSQTYVAAARGLKTILTSHQNKTGSLG